VELITYLLRILERMRSRTRIGELLSNGLHLFNVEFFTVLNFSVVLMLIHFRNEFVIVDRIYCFARWITLHRVRNYVNCTPH